jgi:hypothetical protein
MPRRVMIAATAVLLAGAGGSSGPGPSARTLGPNEYALPSDPSLVLGPDATPIACAGVGLDAVLVGSASDPRKVWLSDVQTSRRIELVWPSGFTAQFDQGTAFDVRNASGTVAIVGGSHVDGACVGDAYWLDTVGQ